MIGMETFEMEKSLLMVELVLEVRFSNYNHIVPSSVEEERYFCEKIKLQITDICKMLSLLYKSLSFLTKSFDVLYFAVVWVAGRPIIQLRDQGYST